MVKNNLNEMLKPLDNTFNQSNDPLLKNNNSTIWIISGRRGTGKSTLCLNVMSHKDGYKKRFSNIFLISPTAKSDKKFSKLVKELDEDGKYFTTFNDENIDNIFSIIERDNDENKKKNLHCLILDDVVLDLPRSKDSLLNKMVINSRHHNTSIIILTQKYNAISTIIRSNADLISFFPSLNNHEIKTFQRDLNIDESLFYNIYNHCCDKQNNFMHCNTVGMPKFYKKFEHINFNPTKSGWSLPDSDSD